MSASVAINPNSKAYNQGLTVGDLVETINGQSTHGLMHNDALQLIRNASDKLQLELRRGEIQQSNGHLPNGDINQNIKNNELSSQGQSRDAQQYKPVSFQNQKSSPPPHTARSEPVSIPSSNVRSTGHTTVSTDRANGESRNHEAPASLSSTKDIKLSTSHSASPSPRVTARITTKHKPGMWTPGQTRMETDARQEEPLRSAGANSQETIPSVWSPTKSPSPPKQYRPVKIDAIMAKKDNSPKSPQPQQDEGSYDYYYRRPRIQITSKKQSQTAYKPEDSYAWKPSEVDPLSSPNVNRSPSAAHATSTPIPSSRSSGSAPVSVNNSPSHTAWNGTISSFADTKSGLPQSQSPTITLLQKNRDESSIIPLSPEIKAMLPEEGQFAKGAIYMGSKETVEGDVKHTDSLFLIPTETSTVRTTEKKAPKYEGTGPTDRSGLPTGLREHVDDSNKKEWYKKMFKSLNESGKPSKDTIRYILDMLREEGIDTDLESDVEEKKNTYQPTYTFPELETESEREEPNPYKPSYEQPSTMTRNVNGKEDTSWKSLSLDRTNFSPTGSNPSSPTKDRSSWSPPHAKYRPDVYRNQPRSITDYEPGFSSIAFREARTSQLYNPPIEKPGQFSQYTLQEDDSRTIKKLNRPLSPSSETNPRDIYKSVHKGGEIPIGGLRLSHPDKRAAGDHPATGLDTPLHDTQSTDAAVRGPTPPWHSHPSLSALNAHQSDASLVDAPADAFGGYMSTDDTVPADTSLSDIGASASDLGASTSDLGASCPDLGGATVSTQSQVVTLSSGEQYVVTSNLVDIEPGNGNSIDADYEEIYAKYKQPDYLAELLDLEFEEYEKRLSEYAAPDPDSGFSQAHTEISTSGDVTTTTQTRPEVVSSECQPASTDGSMSVGMEYSHSNSMPHSNLAYGDNGHRQEYPYYQQDMDMYAGNFSNNSSSGYLTYSRETGEVGPDFAGQQDYQAAPSDMEYMDYSYSQSSQERYREVRSHHGGPPGADDDEIEALYRQELRTHYQMVIKGEVSPDSEIFKQLANGRAASPQRTDGRPALAVSEPEIRSLAVPMGGLGGSTDSLPRRIEEIERERTVGRPSMAALEPEMLSASVPMGGLGGSTDSLPRRLEEIEREVRQTIHGNRKLDEDPALSGRLEDLEHQMRLEARNGTNPPRWEQDRLRDIERDLVNKMDQSYSRREQNKQPALGTSSQARPLNLGMAPDPYPNRNDKPALRESLWDRHDQSKEMSRLQGSVEPSTTKPMAPNSRALGDGHQIKNPAQPPRPYSPLSSTTQQRPKSAPLDISFARPKSAPDTSTVRRRDRSGSPDSIHSWRGVPRNIDLRTRSSAVSECSERSSRIDPQTYQSYAAGILHSTHKSDHFQNLQRHYSMMERIAELESQTLDKSKSLGNLRDEAALLSKYKVENLEELHDLYAELEAAQKGEEFFYKTSHVDADDPWRDWGILAKELSLQELKDIYKNEKPNMNTNRPSRRRRRVDFRRDLSFRKLRDKYKHLDEESRKEKIMEEWWSGSRVRSRRNSDASSVRSSGSQSQGEYMQIMENAARKSKERAMYGYNIDEEHVRYEMYVENLRKMSKSCPDVSEEGLHVRSESEPKAAQADSHRFDSPQRADSYKISRFNGREKDFVDGRSSFGRDSLRKNLREQDRSPVNAAGHDGRWKQNKQSITLTPSHNAGKPEGKPVWESDSPGSSSGIGSMTGEMRTNSSPRDYLSDRPAASNTRGRPWESRVTGHGALQENPNKSASSGVDFKQHEQWRQERRAGRVQEEDQRSGRDNVRGGGWRGQEDRGRGRESGMENPGGKDETYGSWREKDSQGRDSASRGSRLGDQDRWKPIDNNTRQREATLFEGREADPEDFQNRHRRSNGSKEAYMEKRNWRKDSKPVPGAVNAARSIFENQQSSSGQTTPSPSHSLPDMLEGPAIGSGYDNNWQFKELRSSSVPPNDPKHKKVSRKKSYIDPVAYQSIKSRFVAPDPPPRAPKSALPNITPRTPLGRYEARIRDKVKVGESAMSKSKSMPSDLHAPERPRGFERGPHQAQSDRRDREQDRTDTLGRGRPLPMGDHRTQPSRIQAVEPLVVDTGNNRRNLDRPSNFGESQNSLPERQALRNITDEMKRTRPEFHKPVEENNRGSLLRPLERSNIQANISSERADSLSLRARSSRLDRASPWDPKEGSPSWHTKAADRTFAVTGRDSFGKGGVRYPEPDRSRAKSLDRDQFKAAIHKTSNMSYVTSALAHSSRNSPGKDSRSHGGHGSMEKWDSQESSDTLIIKGSDNDLSRTSEDKVRSLPFGNALDRSKSEPNLKEPPRLIDDHTAIVSAEDKPKNFNEIRAQFESGYSSDNPEESPKQFSGVRRTISGDLKEIRSKYEDNNAAFSKNAWEKEQPCTPRASLTGKTPLIVRPIPHKQTANNDPRRDDHTLYEQPWDLRNQDIIRAPSPQSVSRATRDFALNLDMIDREWKSERQRLHYRQQKEGSVTGSYVESLPRRPDSAASWTAGSTLTKSNPELAGGPNKWERQVQAGSSPERPYHHQPQHHAPLHSSTSELTPSTAETLDRRIREETDSARRKQQMERIYAEERRKKMAEEQASNEARRHHDIFTGSRTKAVQPAQKSPIPPASNRFDDGADSIQRPSKKKNYTVRGKARAVYNFNAQNHRELSFRKGDTIYMLRMIDQNWCEGEHHGRVGIFPMNYVEVVTSLEVAQATALSKEGTGQARYSFTAQTSVELSLRKGELVQLIRRVDENWFEGRVGGQQGIFPVSYVEVLRDPETPLITPMSSLAPTPAPSSPGQLSPGSSASQAPTIPDAPLSPQLGAYSTLDRYGSPRNPHSYRQEYMPGQATNPYGTASRGGHRDANPYAAFSPAERVLSVAPPGHMTNGHASHGDQRRAPDARTRNFAEEPQYPRYRAKYRYTPQNEDELELMDGDVVFVMEKCDDGWFVGTSERTKEFGTFPGNYVQPL